MLDKNMTKTDLDDLLKNKGDFVKIDYLTRFIDRKPPIAMRRYAFILLGDLYSDKGMFTEAAKMYNNAAKNAIPFVEKKKLYVKEAEMYVKAGKFSEADDAIKKALSEATANEKKELIFAIKEFYKEQGAAYEKGLKRAQAVKIYEKLLDMGLPDSERKEVLVKLMGLYEKLGKIREYYVLKKIVEGL